MILDLSGNPGDHDFAALVAAFEVSGMDHANLLGSFDRPPWVPS